MGKYIRDYQVDNFSDEDLEQIKPKRIKLKNSKNQKILRTLGKNL